jgi:hypothetical protein
MSDNRASFVILLASPTLRGLTGRYNDAMHTTSRKQAIRNAFVRLGLHATPRAVVQAL